MHLQINLILLFTHIVLVISFSELNLSGDNAINFNLDYKSPDNSASIFDADADADPALWPSEATVDSLGSSYEVSLSADPLTSMGPDDLFDVSNQDLLTDGSCSSAFENTINKRKDRELCAPPKSSELGPQTPGRGGIFDKEFFGELPIGYIPVPSPLEDEENYCPKDVIGKPMYMVCDSGVMQDRQMYYSRGTYTLYNVYRRRFEPFSQKLFKFLPQASWSLN